MLTPNPDHPITVEPAKTRWRALFADHVIADSDEAVVLQEANYPPVVYFPRQDVAMEYMSRSEKLTRCPYKGEAAHYTLLMDGRFAENCAWSYEEPYPAMVSIAERIAFYPDKVEVYPVDDARVNPHHNDRLDVGLVVQHTDTGAGHAQAEPWRPNVSGPTPEGGVR